MPRRKSLQKTKLSIETEQKIIEQVQLNAALYSVKNIFYYNTKHKSTIWESIAAIIGEDSQWMLVLIFGRRCLENLEYDVKTKMKFETR